jgi:hypothetical protein
MGFYLLDRRNQNGDHFYGSRRESLLAIVVHVTAGSEDLDTLNDLSAENVAGYAATTDRDVSWHTGSDTDSWIDLLPSSYTAWHATDYNSCTHGHEISKRTTDWRPMPKTWVDKTLRMAALGPDGKSGLRAIAMRNNIPRRWATKAELDAQRANFRAGRPWKPVGFITHAELQWADRRDPGYVTEGGRVFDTFPRDQFMGLLKQEEDDMQDDERKALFRILEILQTDLSAVNWRVHAIAHGRGVIEGGPDMGKRVETADKLYELLNLVRRLATLVPAGAPLPADDMGPVVAEGEEFPLAARLRQIEEQLEEIAAHIGEHSPNPTDQRNPA